MQKELSKNRIGTGQIIIIGFVWLLMFAMPILFGEHQNGINWNHISKIWLNYLLIFIIFLVNRLLLIPQLLFKGEKILYFTSISLIIIAFVAVVFLKTKSIENDVRRPVTVFPPKRFEQAPAIHPPVIPQRPHEFIPPYGNLLILSVLLIGFDTGLAISVKWINAERNKIQLEKEVMENKMAFLQTQISPHFFMNTLNNIHALVDISTKEAKESIIKLSRLMDYMLYESQTSGVVLKQEIDFITSYVELMKLRFTEEIDIVLDIPPVLPSLKIPPLLTISFIENAFRYGISYKAPSFIHIRINVSETRFFFTIRNSIHSKGEQKKNSGIGIENTRKRLELIYGSNYELMIDDENKDIFEVKLNIPL